MSYFARTMSDAEKVAMLESVLGLVLEQTGPISLSQLDLVKAFQEKRTYKVQEMNGFYWVKSDRPVAPITSGGHDLSYGRPGWEQGPNQVDPDYLRKVMEGGPSDAERKAMLEGKFEPLQDDRPRSDHWNGSRGKWDKS